MNKKDKTNPILFATEHGNNYVYDRASQQMILCHPLMAFLVNMKMNGSDVHEWMNRQAPGIMIEIDGVGTVPFNMLHYYYMKFSMLEANGLFQGVDYTEHYGGRIQASEVKSRLANLRQVTFEVTDRCNLECEYCAYGKLYANYDKRENRNLDPAVAINLLNYLIDLWQSPLNRSAQSYVYISFYGGEPLLNFPFIEKMVDYINNLKGLGDRIRFVFSMTTNGLLLDKYLDFLVKHDFELLVSLDGDEIHNGFRRLKNGKPSFQKIFSNVSAIKEKHPDYFDRFVNFNTVIHKKNSVQDVFDFFKKTFNKLPSVGGLNVTGMNKERKKEFLETYSSVEESVDMAKDKDTLEKEMFIQLPGMRTLNTFVQRYSGNIYADYNDFVMDKMAHPVKPTGTCFPFERKLFLTANGKVLPCERIGQTRPLGFVDKDKVDMDYEEVANLLNRYFDRFQSQCGTCCDSESCEVCIFTIEGGPSDCTCQHWKSSSTFGRFAARQMGELEKKRYLYNRMTKRVVMR